MTIKYAAPPGAQCPICAAPRDPLDDILIPEQYHYDCGMVVVKGKRRWKVKRLCDNAVDKDARPYERTILMALYHGHRSLDAITRFAAATGWVNQALDAENIERQLQALADEGVGLALAALEEQGIAR